MDYEMAIMICSILFGGLILAANYEEVLDVVSYWKHHKDVFNKSPTLESGICDTELLTEKR
jgi:hypothetical protein